MRTWPRSRCSTGSILSAERGVLAALAMLLAFFSTGARADVFTAGEFRITRDASEDTYQLAARLPASPTASMDILWPAGCVQMRAQRQHLGNQAQLVFEARCNRPLGREDFIATPWRLDGARMLGELDGVPVSTTLPRADGGMKLPVVFGPRADRSFSELAPEFLWQGMLHIWIGWDHLAFVLCLCMLARGVRLLGLVTAFTLGHSLSLGLAFFGVLTLPIQPVEAVIALSIVLVAREALLARGRTYQAMTRPLLVATGFGLVHGLGFASALGELGVSMGERWWALVFFNLGVELGQVMFVLLVVGALALLRQVRLEGATRAVSIYLAGGLGVFWALERIAGFPWG
jgi:hypothetical protein